MSEGKISLITNAFARGTDFIIYEKKVIELGGAHLIITYVMDEKSEEIQVLGRVARQGDPGSSIFIITDDNLASSLELNSMDMMNDSNQKIQQKIDEARESKMEKKQ